MDRHTASTNIKLLGHMRLPFSVMEIAKQTTRLPIRVGTQDTVAEQVLRHGKLFPNTVRCIITGPSNCGKTVVLMSMLEEANGLRFENVYMFSKSLQQPKYVRLQKILESVEGVQYYPYTENAEIPPPDKALPNSLFVFDDVATQKQSNMQEYFCMGRHSLVDSIYLAQTYSRIPKQLLRDNANMLVLFRIDDMNLRHVYSDHVTTDMSFERFKDMCAQCWKPDHGFIVISKESPLLNGRYRQGFDHFIVIPQE